MTITYEEFDTTPAGLIAALKTKIVAHPDWTDQGVAVSTTTSTGATTSGGTTVNLTSSAGFVIGQWLVAGVGTANEATFLISNVVGNTVTISGTWGFAYPSGNTFKTRNTVLRSTSVRGADLIVDLEGGGFAGSYLSVAVYRQFTGTAAGGHVDMKNYWIWWKSSGSTMTIPLHVTLSVGKNHLYFSIEGPRPHETFPTSTTYGSMKSYFAFCDLIPYHVTDTMPVAIGIGCPTATYASSVTNGAHQVGISRDSTDTLSWQPGRLGTLDWPTMYTTDVVTLNRTCTIDGNTYLFPYVLASEAEGLRGRLSSFFYCGTTNPSPFTDFPENVGTTVVYDGIVYKLLAVNKGDGTNNIWGPFGSVLNNATVTNSVVVAVPFAVAS